MHQHEKMNYVEFPAKNLKKTKAFFSAVFNWHFTEYGNEYIAFKNEGLDGGFYQSTQRVSVESGSALIVFYSNHLEQTQDKIQKHGGLISRAIFEFPGGRRFHFKDPNDNEYAVWSDH